MKSLQVGDTAILNKIENVFGDEQGQGWNLPMEVRVRNIEDSDYDYGVETLYGEWIAVVFERNMTLLKREVKKQTIIHVKDGQLKVQHTTNTKKNKVSIQRMGTSIGKIKFDEIDSLIGLLTKLKQEV